MEVASIPPGMDAYEDMFKEITRKLYGDETVTADYNYSATYSVSLTAASAGLGPHPNAHTNGSNAPDDSWFTSDESLEWTSSKIASYNPVQKLYRCVDCDCCGFLARVAEHWLGTHANLRVFECPQCPYSSAWARCVRMHLCRQHNAPEQNTMWKESPVLGEVTEYLNRLRDRVDADDPVARGRQVRSGTSPAGVTPTTPTTASPTTATPPQPRDPDATEAPALGKRYSCSSCPYTTDRRDLYTRHEAIHREEKPFHCYICQKQFNRADHVKKHFLRMHRDHPYDLNRIRRHNANASPKMAFYGKYDSTSSQNNEVLSHTGMHHLAMPTNQIHQPTSNHSLNIPTANFPSANTRLSTSNGDLKSPSQIGGMPSILDATKMTDKMVTRAKTGKEKRYSCCYCNWSGVDNWCLKRHLNTHLKPFVCTLCDYKAARSERLATHVLKVHNKRTCGRCNFMADDVAQLTLHQQEHHGQLPAQSPELAPNTVQNSRRVLKRGAWGGTTTNNDFYHGGTGAYPREHGAYTHGPGIYPQPRMQPPPPHHPQGPHAQRSADTGPRRILYRKKANGADRLFNYMEASDSEDEAAGLGSGEDCPHCGYHFVDDLALQTHMVTHHRMGQAPGRPYRCSICGYNSSSQDDIVTHMQRHTTIELRCPEPSCRYVTTYQEAMEEHSRLAHPPLPPLEQKCPHCGFVVLSGVALSRHAKVHHVASADCSGCSRIHSRFERHRNGETWAISDDEEQPDEQQAASEAERIAAARQMRLLRATVHAYKKRFWRSKRARAAARSRNQKKQLLTKPAQSVVKKLVQKYRVALLFRQRHSCYTCHMTRRSIVSIHTPGSLALHRLWRHAHERYPCDSCELRFPRRYQVLLHAARDHSRCPSAASINAAIAEPIVTLTVPQIPLAPPEITPDPPPPPPPQTCYKVPQPSPVPMHHPHHHIQQHIQPPQYGHTQIPQHHMGLPNSSYHTAIPQDAYPYPQGPPAPLPPQPQQQQQHFHSSMYMVPKQMWYPQLPAPSYYLHTPFHPS